MGKAATEKEIEALNDELRWVRSREDTKVKAKQAALKLLARAATAPFGGYDGVREQAELYAISCLEENKHYAEAKRAWGQVVAAWTAGSPQAGMQAWYSLAALQGKLAAKLPTKLRTAAKRAWATGRMCNVYRPRKGASKKQAPKVPARALDQACVEIVLGEWDRARACAVVAAKKWQEAEVLEFVICMHEGKLEAALASLRALATAHARNAKFEHWETICAGLVLLGDPDPALARTCLAAWKRSEGNAPTALFES